MEDVTEEETINKVFEYWLSTMGKRSHTLLTKKRKKVIKDRLGDGYDIFDIMSAIDNCSQSSWHMGDNDRRTIYNDIELICRSGEKLEQFRDNLQINFVSKISRTTEKNIETLKSWRPPE